MPNSHVQEVAPVEASVKCTVSGKHPEVTSAVNSAFCAKPVYVVSVRMKSISICRLAAANTRGGFVMTTNNEALKIQHQKQYISYDNRRFRVRIHERKKLPVPGEVTSAEDGPSHDLYKDGSGVPLRETSPQMTMPEPFCSVTEDLCRFSTKQLGKK